LCVAALRAAHDTATQQRSRRPRTLSLDDSEVIATFVSAQDDCRYYRTVTTRLPPTA
jgi:hypothetical protein